MTTLQNGSGEINEQIKLNSIKPVSLYQFITNIMAILIVNCFKLVPNLNLLKVVGK
ncbi:hypothetical protein PMAG_a1377 [Pseudoalteromonas mariniglutinosa NCIMB 1770]|nr:hypothetical protein [Pseudoalteromonas mariniglutinosa NCIMB 1770]